MDSTALAPADAVAEVDLLGRMEALRIHALDALDSSRQERFGQFFTPRKAAELIGGMPRATRTSGIFRVLDPGAGSGMLMAAVVERSVREGFTGPIHITAVEVDAEVLPWLRDAGRQCERWAAEHGCRLTVDVRHEDFIASRTGLGSGPDYDYDLVIMNPPYAKLAKSSANRRALASYGVDCPNLYAAFLMLGADSLTEGGELVAITPRSFANGPYFERFRKSLLQEIALDRLHVFESRSTVFSDTGVLQENIVFSGTRGGKREKVRFSESNGHLDTARERVVPYEDLVRPEDPHRFLRISTCESDSDVAETVAAMPATVTDLSIQVSTGRVVDFRTRENLRTEPDEDCVPLIYPGNIRHGSVEWPREIRKAQGFALFGEVDRKALLPSGNYVLVKRFSAKEERRRIVAAVWDPEVNGDTSVAIENHLNVFHADGRGLDSQMARGLSIWLNSTLVDKYFRTFSGHTQVNATDLRSLRYPSPEILRILGRSVPGTLPDQESIDLIVDELIKTDGNA